MKNDYLSPGQLAENAGNQNGGLDYNYPGPFDGFGTRIIHGVVEPSGGVRQDLYSALVPTVKTTLQSGPIQIIEQAFAVAPPNLELTRIISYPGSCRMPRRG